MLYFFRISLNLKNNQKGRHHDPSQVHRMMMAYRMGNQVQLLKLVRELCPQSDAPQWRVLDFLGGHLPEGKDLNDVKGILASAEMLRQKCKEAVQHQEGSLDFE